MKLNYFELVEAQNLLKCTVSLDTTLKVYQCIYGFAKKESI